MRLSSVTIKRQDMHLSTLNVLVGANNTGKSTLLREIYAAATSGYVAASDSKWLDKANIHVDNLKRELNSAFSLQANLDNIDNYEPTNAGEMVGFMPFRSNIKQNLRSYGLSGIFSSDAYKNGLEVNFELPKLESANQIIYSTEHQARKFLADIGVVGEFCDSRASGNFSINVQNILQNDGDQSPVRNLRENPALLKSVRDNIKKVFGIEIGFDNIEHGYKPLRILPERKPSRSLSAKDVAKEWQIHSPIIDSQGDGLKAYLKLALSLLDPYSNIIFIDEPETFLHPPQRRALGSLIADMAKRYNKQVFVATHDSEFIRGLLNTGSDVKVMNLKNQRGEHSVVELDLKDIKTVLSQRGNHLKERAPILNEAILNSLFYDKTILTEDENDRVFYEYYSMLRHGVLLQNRRFIGLRGQDEVINFMEKLNTLGINIACILDIDFILDRYAPKFIKDTYPNLHSSHVTIRQAFQKLTDTEKDAFRKLLKNMGARGILNTTQRKQYTDLIENYREIGIYIVHVGELESWTRVSKNNLSEMLRIIEARNPRELNKFIKVVLN